MRTYCVQCDPENCDTWVFYNRLKDAQKHALTHALQYRQRVEVWLWTFSPLTAERFANILNRNIRPTGVMRVFAAEVHEARK